MPRRPGYLTYRLTNSDERSIPLDKDKIVIGRAETCDLFILVDTVSRYHARIELQGNCYVLSDEDSYNGTYINGERIEARRELNSGDEIWLGSSEVSLHFSDPEETQ